MDVTVETKPARILTEAQLDVTGESRATGALSDAEVESLVVAGLSRLQLAGQRVLLIVPDRTRSIPLPLFFRIIMGHVLPQARSVDVLVALGTHPPLDPASMLEHFGLTAETYAANYASVRLMNHAWNDPQALITLGTLPADEMEAFSGGLMRKDVPVRLNRLILDYDLLLVCGPVFPHEVVGFSGGNKYFFPGIAGQEIIDFTHWLGALLTSNSLIGTVDTPVRRIIDRAASMIPVARQSVCSVIVSEGVGGVFIGTPEAAFQKAAALSGLRLIRWTDRRYSQVLAVLPPMYDDIWVGGKGMYKTEPVVEDGGEVILYAPHIKEISPVHGRVLHQVGYHVRDYFVKQWDQFKDQPLGVLGHSTYVRGRGTYEDGVEHGRIQVTLATGIPEDVCRSVNLGYRDPATIIPADWAGRESEGILLVPHAGETLYRMRP